MYHYSKMVLTAYCVKLKKKVSIDDYKIYSMGGNKYMVRGESSKCPSTVTTFVSFETAQKLTGSSKFPKWVVSDKKKKEAAAKKKKKSLRKEKKKEAEKSKKLKEKAKKLKEKEKTKKKTKK
jgi:hypothetical protein